MDHLIAKTPSQLDRCLRLLYAERLQFYVSVCEDDKGKIYYEISVNADDQTFARVREKYRIMIS